MITQERNELDASHFKVTKLLQNVLLFLLTCFSVCHMCFDACELLCGSLSKLHLMIYRQQPTVQPFTEQYRFV